jgi:hypothetical protein
MKISGNKGLVLIQLSRHAMQKRTRTATAMYEARKWEPGHLKEDISNTARPRGGDLQGVDIVRSLTLGKD